MWTTCPAMPAHAGAICRLVRDGLPLNVLPLTIYGCLGVQAYLEEVIKAQAGDRLFLVGMHKENVAGVAEWRKAHDHLFLNHLYVCEPSRGRGLGRLLFVEGMRRLADSSRSTIFLDVFSDNIRTRAWYASLGFTPVSEQVWRLTPLRPPSPRLQEPCSTRGLSEADRAHARYGFSEFDLVTAEITYRIGRIGDGLFRSTTPSLLDDDTAQEALSALDGSRALLTIGPSSEAPERGSLLVKSLRLGGPVEGVWRRLDTPTRI